MKSRPRIRSECLLAFSLLAALLPGFACRPKAPPADRPNIFIALLDGARADHFSSYGYPLPTTPRIDEIARRGVLFLAAFAPDTVTRTSLPRILSSRYFSKDMFGVDGHRWGIWREDPTTIFQDFDREEISLPEVLSAQGYRTMLITNHKAITPMEFGRLFDEVIVVPYPENRPPDEETAARALAWIAENRDRPFFVLYHVMSPHHPYPAKAEDSEFTGGEDPARVKWVKTEAIESLSELSDGWTADDRRILRGLYDGNLRHTDNWVGKIFDRLGEWGLKDRTIFVITADHGMNLGEHRRIHLGGDAFQSIAHVPLIMAWPSRLPSGVRVSGLVELIDLMPTLLELAGRDLPRGKTMDGGSLAPFIRNPDQGKEAVFSGRGIRTPRWLYFPAGDEEDESELLFDLQADPDETADLAERDPRTAATLAERRRLSLEPFRRRFESARRKTPPDYAFYLLPEMFSITPEGSYAVSDKWRRTRTVLEKEAPTKPWLLHREMIHGGLFRIPKNGAATPLRMTVAVPSGDYRVSLLLDTPENPPDNPGAIGLRYRFDPSGDYLLPAGIEPFGRGERPYFYLDLGETSVRDDRFRVEIDFAPPGDEPYIIRHVKFVPAGAAESGGQNAAREAEERKQALKKLGYD